MTRGGEEERGRGGRWDGKGRGSSSCCKGRRPGRNGGKKGKSGHGKEEEPQGRCGMSSLRTVPFLSGLGERGLPLGFALVGEWVAERYLMSLNLIGAYFVCRDFLCHTRPYHLLATYYSRLT